MNSIKIESLEELKRRVGSKVALIGSVIVQMVKNGTEGYVSIELVFTNTRVVCEYDITDKLRNTAEKIQIQEDFNTIDTFNKFVAILKLLEDAGMRLSHDKASEYCKFICEELKDNVEIWSSHDVGEDRNRFDF